MSGVSVIYSDSSGSDIVTTLRKYDPDGNLVFSNSNINADIGSGEGLDAWMVGGDGSFLVQIRDSVTYAARFARYSPSGVLLWTFVPPAPSGGNYARGVTDASGNTYIMYTTNNGSTSGTLTNDVLVKLDPSGNIVGQVTTARKTNASWGDMFVDTKNRLHVALPTTATGVTGPMVYDLYDSSLALIRNVGTTESWSYNSLLGYANYDSINAGDIRGLPDGSLTLLANNKYGATEVFTPDVGGVHTYPGFFDQNLPKYPTDMMPGQGVLVSGSAASTPVREENLAADTILAIANSGDLANYNNNARYSYVDEMLYILGRNYSAATSYQNQWELIAFDAQFTKKWGLVLPIVNPHFYSLTGNTMRPDLASSPYVLWPKFMNYRNMFEMAV